MYRRYKAGLDDFGLPAAFVRPIRDYRTSLLTGAGPVNLLLPALTSSASEVVMASVETQDILEKIRESVDHEGHGESFVFAILGASVSCFCG